MSNIQPLVPVTFPIIHIQQQTESVRTLTFDFSWGAKPGQFVMAWLPGYDEVPLSIAFDDGHQTKITFFEIGDFTQQLAQYKVGDLVGFRGPFGTSYNWEPGQNIAIVGGGYGAAPMFFAADKVVHGGGHAEVILGAKTKDQLMYLEEFETLPRTSLHITTDDGTTGFHGYTTQLLEKVLQEATDPSHERTLDAVFACGPEIMLKSIFCLTEKYKVPSQLSLVRYMKSGYGACGTSVLDPIGIPLSTHGPVLTQDVLRTITEFGSYCRNATGQKV